MMKTKYPMRGQWTAFGGSMKYLRDRPRRLGEEAPLTPEYQAVFEATLKDMAEGGHTARTCPQRFPCGVGVGGRRATECVLKSNFIFGRDRANAFLRPQ